MTDIVERLRWLAADYQQNVPNLNDAQVMDEAADEIERLRKLVGLLPWASLTPEDIGLVKVNGTEHLNWPWYRYPGAEFEYDPQTHGERDIPAPIK